jgi:hypothetical protein
MEISALLKLKRDDIEACVVSCLLGIFLWRLIPDRTWAAYTGIVVGHHLFLGWLLFTGDPKARRTFPIVAIISIHLAFVVLIVVLVAAHQPILNFIPFRFALAAVAGWLLYAATSYEPAEVQADGERETRSPVESRRTRSSLILSQSSRPAASRLNGAAGSKESRWTVNGSHPETDPRTPSRPPARPGPSRAPLPTPELLEAQSEQAREAWHALELSVLPQRPQPSGHAANGSVATAPQPAAAAPQSVATAPQPAAVPSPAAAPAPRPAVPAPRPQLAPPVSDRKPAASPNLMEFPLEDDGADRAPELLRDNSIAESLRNRPPTQAVEMFPILFATAEDHEDWLRERATHDPTHRRVGLTVREEYEQWLVARFKARAGDEPDSETATAG